MESGGEGALNAAKALRLPCRTSNMIQPVTMRNRERGRFDMMGRCCEACPV